MKNHLTFILIIFSFLLTSCLTISPGLRRDIVTEPENISGSYDLILIGGAYADDPDRIAIYDIPGDGYEFKPVTEQYKVKWLSGLSAQIALEKTKEFFSEHCAYNGFISKELTLPAGGSIGYEMIPDYPTLFCEDGNEISVSYKSGDDGVIKVYTWLMLKKGDNKGRK